MITTKGAEVAESLIFGMNLLKKILPEQKEILDHAVEQFDKHFKDHREKMADSVLSFLDLYKIEITKDQKNNLKALILHGYMEITEKKSHEGG